MTKDFIEFQDKIYKAMDNGVIIEEPNYDCSFMIINTLNKIEVLQKSIESSQDQINSYSLIVKLLFVLSLILFSCGLFGSIFLPLIRVILVILSCLTSKGTINQYKTKRQLEWCMTYFYTKQNEEIIKLYELKEKAKLMYRHDFCLKTVAPIQEYGECLTSELDNIVCLSDILNTLIEHYNNNTIKEFLTNLDYNEPEIDLIIRVVKNKIIDENMKRERKK